MTSRFGLDPAALQGGVQAAREMQTEVNGPPTCNKCREGLHGRCPTAIENHGESDWTSDFPVCACYAADVNSHADAVRERNIEYEADFGRRDWSASTRGWGSGAYYPQSDYDKHDWYPGRWRR